MLRALRCSRCSQRGGVPYAVHLARYMPAAPRAVDARFLIGFFSSFLPRPQVQHLQYLH
jgi:hypothetical protein